jgi:hypothetical protein
MSKINGQAFTCENSRFGTDAQKGYSHGLGHKGGSVLPGPLFSDANHSLWLENITEWGAQTDLCWFMWYDKNGNPLINVSGIVGKKDLPELKQTLG